MRSCGPTMGASNLRDGAACCQYGLRLTVCWLFLRTFVMKLHVANIAQGVLAFPDVVRLTASK